MGVAELFLGQARCAAEVSSPLEARVPEVGLRETRDEEEGPFELHAHRLACSRRATMTLTDPAEGRAWAVWLLDHEPAA